MSPSVPKKWILPPPPAENLREFAGSAGIDPLIASILINRGLQPGGEIQAFLNPSQSDLLNPFLLKDMDIAVERIEAAIRNSEKVVVFGDYDVDGVSSTALLMDYFDERGLRCDFYIPDRMIEGYGLNTGAVRNLHQNGTRLIITADCGTTSVEEIGLARELGMDVIVIDHHEVPTELPPATALINPKRKDSEYPQNVLCTVGLAFKLIQALSGEVQHHLLDLVALGTIADVSPLKGENRYLVRAGLESLSRGQRPGVAALKEAAGLREPTVRAGTVGFRLGPRINAAGRLAKASSGVLLLRGKSGAETRKIARDLDLQNRKRQAVEAAMLKEATQLWEQRPSDWGGEAIVLASKDWHPGVVGIGAARMAERYYRPSILLSIGPDGVAKGSARSIPGFHLFDALERCRDLFLRFGGHRAAAGLSLQADQIPRFRTRFSAHVREMVPEEGFRPTQRIDAVARWEDLTVDLARKMEDLQPFGMGNPEPALLLRSALPAEAKKVGGGAHLKFSVHSGDGPSGTPLDVIGFGLGERFSELEDASPRDLVFVPEVNTWQGRTRLQLRLKDFRESQSQQQTQTGEQVRDFREAPGFVQVERRPEA